MNINECQWMSMNVNDTLTAFDYIWLLSPTVEAVSSSRLGRSYQRIPDDVLASEKKWKEHTLFQESHFVYFCRSL